MNTFLIRTDFKEIKVFYLVYFALIIAAYFLDNVAIFLYWSLFFFFLKSKKDYFWIALFFILTESPGYLISYFDEKHNLANYGLKISSLRYIYYQEIVCLLLFAKALYYRNIKFISLFRNIVLVFLTYSLFLFAYSFMYDFPINRVFRTIRALIPLTLFFSIPVLMKKFEYYIKWFQLLKYFIIFVFLVQFIELFIGERLAYALGGVRITDMWSSDYNLDEKELLRPLYSYYYIIITIIIAFTLIASRRFYFNKNELFILSVFGFLSILISGTRGYIIALSVFFILCVVFTKVFNKKFSSLLVFLLLFSFILLIPNVNKQFAGVFSRLSTVELLLKGDLTAGGTLKRVETRAPKVFEVYNSGPRILGYGYSKNFWDNMDNHVGPVTVLLNAGIIGTLIILLLWLSYIIRTLQLSKKNAYVKYPMRILVFGFSILIIIHFTSNIVFSYGIYWPFHGLMYIIPIIFDYTTKYYYFNKNI